MRQLAWSLALVFACKGPPAAPPPPPPSPASSFRVAEAHPFGRLEPCKKRGDRPLPTAVAPSSWPNDQLDADLDGDGVPERVRLRHTEASEVIVSIGDAHRWLYTGAYARPGLVDLDPRDRSREVLLGTQVGGGQILRYQDERIVPLHGDSRSLTPDEPGVASRRVSFAVLGNEIVILAELDGKELRARLPAYACRPGLGIVEVDIDRSDERKEWLVSIEDDESASYLLLWEDAEGLDAHGPFPAANSLDVPGDGTFTVAYWDCGRRSLHVWDRGRVTTSTFGRRDPALCGRVQLLRDDLDGDTRSDDIVVGRGFVSINGLTMKHPHGDGTARIVGHRKLVVTHSLGEDDAIHVFYGYDGKRVFVSGTTHDRQECCSG